jgi:hypothetical protein
VVETQAANRGVTAPLGLGARVGIEHAHTVTTERPGAFQETARGVLAITNRAAIFVGGRDVSIDHRNVVGLGADRNTCVVHDRHASTPVRFTANGGWAAVAAAFINAGIRQLD